MLVLLVRKGFLFQQDFARLVLSIYFQAPFLRGKLSVMVAYGVFLEFQMSLCESYASYVGLLWGFNLGTHEAHKHKLFIGIPLPYWVSL